MTKLLFVLIIILILAGLGVFVWRSMEKPAPPPPPPVVPAVVWPLKKEIGKSVEGRSIESFQFGDGANHLLFVGGMHGGYEWNSVYLAYEFIDYFESNPTLIPANLKVTIVPSLNPDGVFKVIGKEGRFAIADAPAVEATVPGRFNAHQVDLNRNFDCEWQATSTWRGTPVSAGTAPFSEPEAKALRDFVLAEKPRAVIFWHSQANAVYPGECGEPVAAENLAIMNAYSAGSGYPAITEFTAYPVNGDSEGWLATVGVHALTVELKTHETVEWEQNLGGVKALFNYYQK